MNYFVHRLCVLSCLVQNIFFAILLGISTLTHADEAADLFVAMRQLAEQGNPEAQYHIGMMYNNGMGVAKNPQDAMKWFEQSAQAGDALAAYKLGCYYAGQFDVVKMDFEKALRYKMVAAKAGYALAQLDVAQLLWEKDNGQNPQNLHEAINWLDAAARQGDEVALVVLIGVYSEGEGDVPADPVKAYVYLNALSQLGAEYLELKSALDEEASNLSAAQLQQAKSILSHWMFEKTLLTQKAQSGISAATELLQWQGK